MRRLFIIRKDLHLSPGKLAAMVAHCAEAYWTNTLRHDYNFAKDNKNPIIEPSEENIVCFQTLFPKDVWKEYVNGSFTKTICEAKNLNRLKKVEEFVADINSKCHSADKMLRHGVDWGYINDNCLTELTPENENGTTTVGVWFRPLPDEVAHLISKKYPLYRDDSHKEDAPAFRFKPIHETRFRLTYRKIPSNQLEFDDPKFSEIHTYHHTGGSILDAINSAIEHDGSRIRFETFEEL